MRKQHLLGLLTLVMLTTACGKSMSLTTKAPVLAPPADKSAKHALKDNDVLAGKLLPFSSYDMSMLKSDLLFVDSDASGNAISAIGSPEYVINGESAKQGFVKQSNVVFRAIWEVPPVAAYMKKVEKFKLVLKDVRFYDDGTNGSPEDALKNQVLCLVDADPAKLKCAGGKLDLTNKNVNPFWKSATLSVHELAPFADFKSIYDMKGNEKIYQYMGATASVTPTAAASLGLPDASSIAASVASASESLDDASATVKNKKVNPAPTAAKPTKATPVIEAASLEIDLQAAFGIADADIAQWIIDNSTVYDASGNYRKFRFQLGNNIYAKEGRLEFVYDKDDTVKLPSPLASSAEAPVNGDSDVSKDTDYQTGIKVDDSTLSGSQIVATIPDSEFSFDLDTDGKSEKISDVSMANLKLLAQDLMTDDTSLIEIDLNSQMDIGGDTAGSETKASARAALIAKTLSDLGVKTKINPTGSVIAKDTCAAGGECQVDRNTTLTLVIGKEVAATAATGIEKQITSVFSGATVNGPSAVAAK